MPSDSFWFLRIPSQAERIPPDAICFASALHACNQVGARLDAPLHTVGSCLIALL